ncbi:hypothetical protein MRX96_048061 [Rhipicephalus microplus]
MTEPTRAGADSSEEYSDNLSLLSNGKKPLSECQDAPSENEESTFLPPAGDGTHDDSRCSIVVYRTSCIAVGHHDDDGVTLLPSLPHPRSPGPLRDHARPGEKLRRTAATQRHAYGETRVPARAPVREGRQVRACTHPERIGGRRETGSDAVAAAGTLRRRVVRPGREEGATPHQLTERPGRFARPATVHRQGLPARRCITWICA